MANGALPGLFSPRRFVILAELMGREKLRAMLDLVGDPIELPDKFRLWVCKYGDMGE